MTDTDPRDHDGGGTPDAPRPAEHSLDPAAGGGAVRWHLSLHPEPLLLARLPPHSPVPEWSRRASPLSSVTWNAHETSVIAAARWVPPTAEQAGPFLAFEIQGPLDFTLIGVLQGLLAPLADREVSVITMSTFDTDWILVPVDQVAAAVEAWRARGHVVEYLGEEGTS